MARGSISHIARAVSDLERSRLFYDKVFEKLYEFLKQIGATILDAPAEYPYAPGYYAVYFTDPDGLKVEFAHAEGFDRYRAEPNERSRVGAIITKWHRTRIQPR